MMMEQVLTKEPSDGAALMNTLPRSMRRLVQGLNAALNPDSVYLFGSRATGKASEGSDIDIILVMSFEQIGMDSRKEVEAIVSASPVIADVLLVDREKFEKRSAAPLSFLGSIKPLRVC